MLVVPVAGRDSMLLNLSGAHGPYFTRNVVVVTDSAGNTGVGEVPGGEKIRETLEDARELVLGQAIGGYLGVLRSVERAFAARDASGRGLQTFDLRVSVHAVTALEAAFLDLFGQHVGLPVAALLGRASNALPSRCSAIFSSSAIDARPTCLIPMAQEPRTRGRDFVARRPSPATTSSLSLKPLASATASRISNSKAECCLARPRSMSSRPCPHGFPRLGSPSIRTGLGRSTRRLGSVRALAASWPMPRILAAPSAGIPLADPHFWTMAGSVRVAQMCRDWGLTWGSHSNNHFDISLAMFTQVAAAAPGQITAIDTHWIWQDGQRLTQEPLRIFDGRLAVPERAGLGVEIDMAQLEAANALYKSVGGGARDDAAAMRYLLPEWTFDNKRPCLVR